MPAAFKAVPASFIRMPVWFRSAAPPLISVRIEGKLLITELIPLVVFSKVSLMESTLVLNVSTLVAMVSNGLVLPTVMPETKVNLIPTISRLLVLNAMVGTVMALSRVTINPKPVDTGPRKVRVSEAPVLMVWSEVTNWPRLSNAVATSESLAEEAVSLSPVVSSLVPTVKICVPTCNGSNGILNGFRVQRWVVNE